MAATFFLKDQKKGDGGLCVVNGSHKTEFAPSQAMMDGEDEEFMFSVQQPDCNAGDVLLHSEALIHGCFPWVPEDRDRRVALYRFSPSFCAYARQYVEPWPESYLDGMDEH